MNTFGTLVVLAAFAAGAALAGTAFAETRSPEDPTFSVTCNYFETRSARLTRSSDRSWLPVLAESCGAALAHLRAEGPNATDQSYLQRLSALRSVVISMNVNRLTGHRGAGGRQFRVTVTGSGEYLIAHYLGVVEAYETWAHENGFETAALPSGH